jgi:hypothetical protein
MVNFHHRHEAQQNATASSGKEMRLSMEHEHSVNMIGVSDSKT